MTTELGGTPPDPTPGTAGRATPRVPPRRAAGPPLRVAGPPPRVVVRLMRAMSRAHTAVYRATGGRVGHEVGGLPVCLLTTRGRRSGERRATTLSYVPHGEALLVVPANAGSGRLPGWYHNLVAEPRVLLQIGRDVRRMTARTADEAERDRLWPQVVAAAEVYARHQQHQERLIPVVVLEPVRGEAP